jgi:hypothetical protein
MGATENLYFTCTILGTIIFALLFLHYYIDTENEVEEPAAKNAAPVKTSRREQRQSASHN